MALLIGRQGPVQKRKTEPVSAVSSSWGRRPDNFSVHGLWVSKGRGEQIRDEESGVALELATPLKKLVCVTVNHSWLAELPDELLLEREQLKARENEKVTAALDSPPLSGFVCGQARSEPQLVVT